MVKIEITNLFKRNFKRLTKKDNVLKKRVQETIRKIIKNPKHAEFCKYAKHAERKVYIGKYRFIYAFHSDIIYFLNFEHRKKVYRRK